MNCKLWIIKQPKYNAKCFKHFSSVVPKQCSKTAVKTKKNPLSDRNLKTIFGRSEGCHSSAHSK